MDASLSSIKSSRPDFAVLDFNFDGKTWSAVAAELGRLKIPFVLVTGYDDAESISEQFGHVPIVRKPISKHALAETVAQTGVHRMV